MHPLCAVGPYGSTFWEMKSKAPYQWRFKKGGAAGASPWVGFVGYQLRYDGHIRIRKSSMQKQHEKLIEFVDTVLWSVMKRDAKGVRTLRKNPHMSKKQIIASASRAMVCMGVGRINHRIPPTPGQGAFSWCGGFRALCGRNADRSQMKRLDRQRRRQFGRVFKNLSVMKDKKPSFPKQIPKRQQVDYYGIPYSYYWQIFGVK